MARPLLALIVSACVVACGSTPKAKAPGEATESSGATAPAGDDSTAAQSGDAKAQPAAFPKPSNKDAALEKRAVKMEFDLTLMKNGSPAGIQSGSWSISEERTYEVRTVSGDAITAMQVLYGRRIAKPLLGLETPSVTENKTYLVKASGGTPSVTHADQPAPDAERDAVLSEYGWVGAPSPLVVMLRGAKPGAKLAPPVDARRDLLGDLPGIDESTMDVQVVFKGTGGDARPYADVDVTAKGPLTSGDMAFQLDLAGPARIDLATGWVTALSLSGKVKATGKVKFKKTKLDSSGHGTMTITRSATFH